ncbi:S-layer domain protein [Synechococcus sp. PCC 7335]|uniref:S-layer homology domain-containing protein n=1 Tax=Synechococcus sp. (strain ATCC 29403 / PCC 7335) TaxID=91464 RepID=UPI00017ED267|nr:S-layer homology domain-containing protein [Synechococcus sp. PCC 7335]EDX84296.1 S-layer domain protein [Synechococcus sp. PCC 7335]
MFPDTTHHWAKGCIVALAKRGMISGYANTTFRPLAVVSRAEFAALMRQSFPGLPTRQSARPFPDVPPQYWANEVIAWASERGLLSGDRSGRFLPMQAISRVQAVVVLMAALSAEQTTARIRLPKTEPAEREQLIRRTFTDATAIPDYGREAVGQAIAANLFESQLAPRAFLPNQSITRGEVAAILCWALAISVAELTETSPLKPALTRDRKGLFEKFIHQEAEFNAEKLAFLDRGIQSSPFRNRLSQAVGYLQQTEPQAITGQSAAIPSPLENTATYPIRGDRPEIDATGLDFLAPDILSACVCLSTMRSGELRSRWLGREAFVNRQMWSATKFLPLLKVIEQANKAAPNVPIGDCSVHPAGSRSGFPFHVLANGTVSYDNRVATSNSLAAMFKRFTTPERLEKWTQQLTGNQQLAFQGRYGEVPFIEFPELWSANGQKVLESPRQAHRGQNLVSTYDLTRLITIVGWHWRLPPRAVVPNVQGHSLSSLIQAMGVDTARYIDVALETLSLTEVVRSPVIISKCGFGRSDQRDRTELTYCALAEFDLPRVGACDPTASHQHYSIGMTLIAAQQTGDIDQEARFVDALMATEVTEIIQQLILGKL